MKRCWGFVAAGATAAFLVTSVAPSAFADPPPWAPAWGHRAKHGHKDRRHDQRAAYAVPFGIDLGRCNRAAIGAVVGGAAGGIIGAHVGKGDGRTAAIIGGSVIGILVGGAIGQSMDRLDQSCVGQVLEHAPTRQAVAWRNPDNAQYRVTPVRTFEAAPGTYCREYQATATIGGRSERTYGTACRQPDGAWKVVN